MRTLGVTLVSIAALMLAACSEPLPAERAPYVGVWRGGAMLLVIQAGGRVVYQRKEGSMSKTLRAPLKEFKGDNFIVGVGPMSTEFAVSSPPHEQSGVWQMTVDGVEVTKTSEDPDQLAAQMGDS
jgi:hypothetical protein